MASGNTPYEIKIYLSSYDAGGYQCRLEQLKKGSVTSPVCHFLANEETDEPLFVTECSDYLHSHACLNVYASTVTLCVFEDTTEGTWVLPPGWNPGTFNILERVPVKCSSAEQETLIQLRPGDQILSKGGRWSIDMFARQPTPNINSSSEGTLGTKFSTQSQVSRHSPNSRIENANGLSVVALSSKSLHRLLELDEPSRAISWARSVYCCEENHTILQVFLCQHYKSTFEMYGSLISPLILFKAVQYAFPTATFEKRFGGLEYAVKGIRLRIDESEISRMAENDQADVVACPCLREISLSIEDVSPSIVDGMKIPTWKVMEDSQATSSVGKDNLIAVDEDSQILEPFKTAQRFTPSADPVTLNEHVESIPSCEESDMLPVDATMAQNRFAAQAAATCEVATESGSDNQKNAPLSVSPTLDCLSVQSPPVSTAPITVSFPRSSLAAVNRVSEQDEEYSSLAAPNEYGDEFRLQASQHNDRHSSSTDNLERAETPEEIASPNGVPPTTAPAGAEQNDSLNKGGHTRLEVEPTKMPPRSRNKRSRRMSCQPPVSVKKIRTDDRLNSKDGHKDDHTSTEHGEELDGDNIVVESRHPIGPDPEADARAGPGGGEAESLVQHSSRVKSLRAIRGEERRPQPLSKSRVTEPVLARQDSGQPPRVVFSSTTDITSEKTIMTFFRECGGKEVKHIAIATILCVGTNQPLKKSANLVLAVCMGLDVVTDRWLVESQRKGFFLDPQLYLPKDPQRESQWNFKLDEAIARGRKQGALTGLLAGTNVYFTHGLKSLLAHNFRDFTTVATCLGADAVKIGLPKVKREGTALILGTADDHQTLQASRMGLEVWSKDLLVMGALRGEIQRTYEFNIAKPMKEESGR